MATDPKILADMQSMLDSLKRISAAVDGPKAARPYYTPKYAETVKETIDRILESGEVLFFPASEVQLDTLKQQWYQGRDYLISVLDPSYEAKVTKIEASIDKRKNGLVVALKPERGMVEPAIITKWREELNEFIDKSELQDKFVRQGLGLSDADVVWLYETLEPLKDIFAYDYELKRGIIRVIRYA